MNRLFFPLFLLFFVGFSQALEDSYQVITADNLSQLQVVGEFRCDAYRYSLPAAAFRGDFFLTDCPEENRIYSLIDGELVQEFEDGGGARVQFLRDDLLLFTGSSRFLIYNTQGESILSQEIGRNSPLAVSPDGSHIAFMTADLTVEQESYDVFVYSLPDFEPVEQSFSFAADTRLPELALSNADASLIAMGEAGGRIRIFNWETGELVTEIADSPFITTVSGEYGSGDYPTEYAWLAFSPDSSELYTTQCTHMEMGCWDTGIVRYEATTGEILASMEYANGGEFYYPVFLAGGIFLHSSSCHDGLRFYDMQSLSEMEYRIQFENCELFEVSYSANEAGTLIAAYEYANQKFLLYGIPAE